MRLPNARCRSLDNTRREIKIGPQSAESFAPIGGMLRDSGITHARITKVIPGMGRISDCFGGGVSLKEA